MMDGRTELEIPRVCVSLGCFPSLPLSLSLSVFVVVVARPRSHLAPLQEEVLDAGEGGELDGAPRHHLEDSWGAPPPEPEDALLLCNLRDHAGNCLAALAGHQHHPYALQRGGEEPGRRSRRPSHEELLQGLLGVRDHPARTPEERNKRVRRSEREEGRGGL